MNSKQRCSICKDVDAIVESTANPGVYYCHKCAAYVSLEYGENRLKPIEPTED